DLLLAPLEEGSWFIPFEEAISLTGRTDLSDHSLRQCPDGSWLHVASAVPTNHIYRYDDSFGLVAESEYLQGEPPHAANDVPAVCGPRFQGFGIAEQVGLRDFFIDVDQSASLSVPTEMTDSPRMTGAGLLDDDNWSQLLAVGVDPGPNLTVSAYGLELELQERWIIERPLPEIVLYWPSSFTRVGDYFLILTMGRDPAENWDADTGDVYLFVVDETFTLLEWHQITFADPFLGGFMRPWLQRKEDTIVMGFDKQNAVFIAHATLDLEAFGINDTEDEDPPSNEADERWKEDQSPTVTPNGGCRDKSQAILPILYFPFLIRARRRKKWT
ncbi:MAG: hypothetical protein ACON4U_01770, partial [Myxococcota bacterium]